MSLSKADIDAYIQSLKTEEVIMLGEEINKALQKKVSEYAANMAKEPSPETKESEPSSTAEGVEKDESATEMPPTADAESATPEEEKKDAAAGGTRRNARSRRSRRSRRRRR